MPPSKDLKLSKTLLELKFMKKSKERILKEKDDAEGQSMYSSEITDEMKRAGNIVFVDASLAACNDLIDGRLSFGGMNADLEKLMASDGYGKRFSDAERLKEKDVTDKEMAAGPLAHTMANKFQKKRNRGGGVKQKTSKPSSEQRDSK